MSVHGRIFDSFLAETDLSSHLASMSAHERLKHAYVGLQIKGRRLFAAVQQGARLDPTAAENHPVPAECLTKPLTATLLAEAASTHHLSWSDEIGGVLEIESPWKARLAGISLANLLNHTHGLDSPTASRIPRTSAGMVDIEALCGQLAATPLCTPGRLYSYSNTGSWFVGALLERLSGRPYSQLLHERRLWPPGPAARPRQAGDICPATGENLELSVSQWLAFVSLHSHDTSEALASLRAKPVPLPGWSPSEQGACLGWKYYGGRWFGHNSNARGSSALLRFNPELDIAIVVEASDDAAFIVLAGLFGKALPEFANLRPPRMLTSRERVDLRFERYTGTYIQARSRIGIDVTTAQASICLTAELQSSGAVTAARRLRAAEGDIFIPESQGIPEFPFIQFVVPEPARSFGYLWNGKQLWRRE